MDEQKFVNPDFSPDGPFSGWPLFWMVRYQIDMPPPLGLEIKENNGTIHYDSISIRCKQKAEVTQTLILKYNKISHHI